MLKRMMLVGALLGSMVLGAHLSDAVQAQPSAPAGEVVWYRIVNQGRSAGTMARWARVGEGAAATFPFLDNFEVDIRPAGDVVNATVRDGQTQFVTSVSCTRPNAPHRVAVATNRIGDNLPVISLALQCSATEPSVR